MQPQTWTLDTPDGQRQAPLTMGGARAPDREWVRGEVEVAIYLADGPPTATPFPAPSVRTLSAGESAASSGGQATLEPLELVEELGGEQRASAPSRPAAAASPALSMAVPRKA